MKTAFITGAGSGLGRELALILEKRDYTLALTDIDEAALQETASLLKSPHKLYTFDVSDYSAFETAFLDFTSHISQLDLLINNAGIGEGSLFEEYSAQNWDHIIGINLKGVIHGSKLAIQAMKDQNTGTIVNIASSAGYANLPKMSPYNITKAAVISLSESLKNELIHTNINIICPTPYFFRSNIISKSRGSKDILQKAAEVVNNAKMDAREAATHVMKAIDKKTFASKFPFEAKALWTIKKWFPFIYKSIVKKLAK